MKILLACILLLSVSSVMARGMTLDQAITQVQQEQNGEIVSAKTRSSEKGRQHVIRVLTPEGRVLRYVKPAREKGRNRR